MKTGRPLKHKKTVNFVVRLPLRINKKIEKLCNNKLGRISKNDVIIKILSEARYR